MELTIKERILLAGILPKGGTYAQQKASKSLLEKITIKEDERESLSMVVSENSNGNYNFSWDMSRESPKDFDIDFNEVQLLKETFEVWDLNAKITQENLSIFDKIFNLS